MATESGPPNSCLSQETVIRFLTRQKDGEQAFFSTEFFQAVRLLSRVSRVDPPGGYSADFEGVRFKVTQEGGFPPSAIRSLTWDNGDASVDSRTDAASEVIERRSQAVMEVACFGLNGPSGVLPLVFSECVRRATMLGDHAPGDFLDIFNHRAISLFYRAWESVRFEVKFERGEPDGISEHLLDFVGLGIPGLAERLQLPTAVAQYYCGLIASAPRSACALERFLADWLDVDVQIEQFEESWQPLLRSDCCTLSDTEDEASCLGLGAVLGDAVFDCATGVLIRIGPLALVRFREFLPDGAKHQELLAATRFFSNDMLTFDIQLILSRTQIPEIQLGDSSGGLALGWTTWLPSRSGRRSDPSDVRFRLTL